MGGGAIFNFSQKIGLKSTKNVPFCILHKPMGGRGLEPPPGYATVSKEARLLGVTLDRKITWKPHITQITRKATTALMNVDKLCVKRGE